MVESFPHGGLALPSHHGHLMRYIVAASIILLLLPQFGASPTLASGNPVGQMVADFASLPTADPNSCQGVISAVQGGGAVEQELNQAFGTDFQPITVNSAECSVLVTFLPIVGSYNGLIVAAQQYNPNNQTSVNALYEKAFLLAAEVTIVGIALDGTLYKVAFQSTGELNDGLELGKLQSLCGDECYSDVLSSLYWFIKGTCSSLLDNFMSWASQYLPNLIQAGNQFKNQVQSETGVPEFPNQLAISLLATLIVVAAYLGIRKREEGEN